MHLINVLSIIFSISCLICFYLALNLGVPGQNSSQGSPASVPYDGFNPDSLLTSNKNSTLKTFSKLSTPTNNYLVSAISTASRPDSPTKKKVMNMAVAPVSLSSQQQKTKPLSTNSHMLSTMHQSTTSGITTGNTSTGTKSAFSVVLPPASSSTVKLPSEDGEMVINRNMFLKDASGATIDVLHSINNSNNQFRVVTTAELLSTNNLHWKQTSLPETVTSALQNSLNSTSGELFV